MTFRMVASLTICLLIVASAWTQTPRLIVYNPTTSAPLGWYLIEKTNVLHVGDYVLAELPPAAATLAAERGYLPRGIPILKRIGATFGQRVCVQDRVVSIDERRQAFALRNDAQQRQLPTWGQCRVLHINEFFLLNPQRSASFDSRYFGPIERGAVLGRARPLWTWTTP